MLLVAIQYEDILTRGPSVPKFYTRAQRFALHVVSIYFIEKGGKEKCVF